MDLTELRQKIDAIDDQLVALFGERMEVAEKIAEYKSSQPNYDVIITNWPAAFHYMPNNFFTFIRNKILIQYFQNYLDCFLKPITLYVRSPRRQTAHVNPIG